MKQLNIKIQLLLAAFFMLSAFFGCTKDNEAIKIGIVDMNGNIAQLDKPVVQAGDTITFTGTNLDQVYKIMLNNDPTVVVRYRIASSTELKMAVPSAAPLGDVVSVNFLFSGKGIANRSVKIISPPVIFAMSPAAAHDDVLITVTGKELYLTQQIFIGSVDVTASYKLIDDKKLTIRTPAGFAGGKIKIVTASGGASFSTDAMTVGTEVLLTNFDDVSNYLTPSSTSISSNGNLDNDVQEVNDAPYNNIYTFTLKDNGQGWGGNVDFLSSNLPTNTYTDLSLITLSLDIKLTKAMGVNVMIARSSDVWGKTLPLVVGWNHVVLKFSDMGSNYQSTPPTDPAFMPLPLFSAITGVKIQPPAQTANGNFGEKISVDNIKFIIAN